MLLRDSYCAMAQKKRKAVTISITVDPRMLPVIRSRMLELGRNRSNYLALLVTKDIEAVDEEIKAARFK